MENWSQEEQEKWKKDQSEGSIFSDPNWPLVALLAKKMKFHFATEFQFNLNVPRKGDSLELAVIPNKLLSYDKAILAFSQAKAYVAGFKASASNT